MRQTTEARIWRHDALVLLAVVMAVMALLAGAVAARGAEDQEEFTSEFDVERCTWSGNSDANPFFSLRPGHQNVLAGEEEDDGEVVEVEAIVTVLAERERIVFHAASGKRVSLLARVVEERESVDGELAEVSRNFFALCRETRDVFYFGETVDNYEDGEIVNHNGAWRAGKNGALPGIIMPGRFLLGSRYFQEIAPGVALDRGENTAMGLDVTTEAGTFHDCVEVVDTNALNPESEGDVKVYCPGIGIVRDEDLELVEFESAQHDD